MFLENIYSYSQTECILIILIFILFKGEIWEKVKISCCIIIWWKLILFQTDNDN